MENSLTNLPQTEKIRIYKETADVSHIYRETADVSHIYRETADVSHIYRDSTAAAYRPIISPQTIIPPQIPDTKSQMSLHVNKDDVYKCRMKFNTILVYPSNC